MTGETILKVSAEVKALRIVLLVLLFLYGLVFAGSFIFLVRVFPSFVAHTSEAGFWSYIRVSFGKVLTGLIYFFIAFCIFRLINLISRGDPYNPASPRIIRRIGCAVLSLAVINAVVMTLSEFTSPSVYVPEVIVRILYHSLSTLLLGFGFLVIARVIETGVRLQQDQNLTV
jgi:hypothetical protein